MAPKYMVEPPHSEALIWDDLCVRPPCWCNPDVHIDVAETDEGEVYRYPHHVHGHWYFHAWRGPDGKPPT